jgi:glycosyltransferase involved in cell wall biosynthesis
MSHKMNLGGTEKAMLSFIGALKCKGVRVTLLLLEDGGALRDEIPAWVDVQILEIFDSIKPVIFDPPFSLCKQQLKNSQIAKGITTLLRYARVKITKSWYYNYKVALDGFISTFHADIAIAYAGPSDFISYFILHYVAAPKKYQWIHFDVSKIVFTTNFGNKFYAQFDTVFCVSENAKIIFDKMFPQYANKTAVFKNIVSNSELIALAALGATFEDNIDGLRILTVGRLSKEKGQQMIPVIVSKLKKDNFKFRWYLIGDGDLHHEISAAILHLDISDSLVLLGSKNNPYRYVKDCDVYVQTSFHEGYCLTVHEAKIFNKPVLTTCVASAANLIADNEDGLIVAISEEAIYDGVKLLLGSEDLRFSFSKNLKAADTTTEIDKIFF